MLPTVLTRWALPVLILSPAILALPTIEDEADADHLASVLSAAHRREAWTSDVVNDLETVDKVSALEWENFQLTNEKRAEGFRCPRGKFYPPNPEPLIFDCRLWRASKKHSLDMKQNNYFDHTSKDGRQPVDRAKAEGIDAWSENIARGSYGPQRWPRLTGSVAEQVLTSWLRSPYGHCNNLGNPNWKMFAVGSVKVGSGPVGSPGEYVWTEMFRAGIVTADTSCYPEGIPTYPPTRMPTRYPRRSSRITRRPTRHPSGSPSGIPTYPPTGMPTPRITRRPTRHPSGSPSGLRPPPGVVVTSTAHENNNKGKYFFFDKDQWIAKFSTFGKVEIIQSRGSQKIWQGQVIVWDSLRTGTHGRRNGRAADNQWKVGDILSPVETPTTLLPTSTETPTLPPTSTEAPTLPPTSTEAPTLLPTSTEAPTRSPTRPPVSPVPVTQDFNRGDFVVGERGQGTGECPLGSVSIVSEADCEAAAHDLGYGQAYKGAQFWGQDYPNGCFLYEDKEVSYIRGGESDTDLADPYLAPLCKSMPGQLSTWPPRMGDTQEGKNRPFCVRAISNRFGNDVARLCGVKGMRASCPEYCGIKTAEAAAAAKALPEGKAWPCTKVQCEVWSQNGGCCAPVQVHLLSTAT